MEADRLKDKEQGEICCKELSVDTRNYFHTHTHTHKHILYGLAKPQHAFMWLRCYHMIMTIMFLNSVNVGVSVCCGLFMFIEFYCVVFLANINHIDK